MKYKFGLILAVFAVMVFLGCDNSSGSSKEEVNFDKDASYALGLYFSMDIRGTLEPDGIYPNIDEFLKGMRDGLKDRNQRFEITEAWEKIGMAFEALQEEKLAEAEIRNAGARQEEIAFLSANAGKPGITMTPSGLQYEIVSEGRGPKPALTDFVRVHYEGRFIDNTMFDNTYEHQRPAIFSLDMVIDGWSEGLQLMNVGSTYRFYIPSEIGYGPQGHRNIPPYATLIFVVELLGILTEAEAEEENRRLAEMMGFPF
ncbi:MAG: FKBP-type peptidyl-prolyl cis-trans isomerase [Treponema sp.]|nr:FKBP-type peptidyl-prolyl cis-trans isomerase [Treponema sp.]